MDQSIRIVPATEQQIPLILELIRGLAEYEKLGHEVVATEESLRTSLFGARPDAEVIIAYAANEPAGFALFFHNYSTFLGRRGLYLEDLFVKPPYRGRGVGRALLQHLARLAVDSDWTVYRVTGDALAELAGGATAPGPSGDRS